MWYGFLLINGDERTLNIKPKFREVIIMETADCGVLVLKNNEQVRDLAKGTLVLGGFKDDNIFLAKNVKEAKKIILSQEIDLVLTGIGTLEEEGPALLSWMTKTGIRGKMKVIFYSGGDEDYVREKVDEYGADAFLSLPVDRGVFVAIIKEIVREI